MFSFAARAIRRLNEASLPVFILTNQSGVARGYFPESLVREVHERMERELRLEGARIDGIYYCPHGSADACECRKPATGMIERAAREHNLDVSGSFVVGDRYSDIELASRAGCKSVFVRTGYGLGEETWHAKEWTHQPDTIVDNLEQAVDWILRQNR
jgi:D-glycero-D-manno-heptose 1,7-bisphosphate phosphatase